MASATATKKTTAKRPAKKVTAVPASKHTPARHMRIPDEIWDAADVNAKSNGFTGVSELTRTLLRDYNAGKRMG